MWNTADFKSKKAQYYFKGGTILKKEKSLIFSAIAMLLVSIMTFTGCSPVTKTVSSNAASASSKSKDLITLTFPTYRSGENVGAKFFLPQVERFNKKYEGQYKIVIESIPQDSYDTKIKTLAQAASLPSLVDGIHDTVWLKDFIAKNKLSYDLKSWINENPDIAKLVIKDSLDYCTVDNRVFVLPIYITSPVGSYYNKTMYKPGKAIKNMTVAEFQTSLGANKMAFGTSENAWTTQLFFTSLIANQPGGVELLQKHTDTKLLDFNSDIMINAVTQLQSFLQKNASANTVGGAYADAANAFMSKTASIIWNGPWMFADFDAASKEKWSNGFSGDNVQCDLYPGNFAMANTQTYGTYWIAESASAEQKEAALALISFVCTPAEVETAIFQLGGIAPNLKMSDDFISKTKSNILLTQYLDSFDSNTKIVPTFDDIIYPSVAQPGFPNLLPDLISGKTTPAAFCQKLTDLSKEASTK